MQDGDVEKEEDHDVKDDDVEDEEEEGPITRPRGALCSSLRNRNECQNFTGGSHKRNPYLLCSGPCDRNSLRHVTGHIKTANADGHLGEKGRSPDRAQKADTHSLRACAVERHIKISQEPEQKWLGKKGRCPE